MEIKSAQVALAAIFGVMISEKVIRALQKPAPRTELDQAAAKKKLMAGEV